MTEGQHLAEALGKYFSDPNNGVFTPFITATDGLTTAQAAAVPAPRFNSVWGVVNHVWFWQEATLLGICRACGWSEREWHGRCPPGIQTCNLSLPPASNSVLD